jgi:hypothetical protein
MTILSEALAKLDGFELVRDEIAAILLQETAAGQPIRVFLERSNPWEEYLATTEQDENEEAQDERPIVNVSFDASNTEESSSNSVARQTSHSTYHLDCYALGVSRADLAGGHEPGDQLASLNAQACARIVRNILMAGEYTYLGLRGIVGWRRMQSIQMFQPRIDARTVQQVVGARLTLQVRHGESSPQVQGQPLETISASVKRRETGEIYLSASYGVPGEEDS